MGLNFKKQKISKIVFKTMLATILNSKLFGKNQIIFKKFFKLSKIFLNKKFLIYKGQNFVFFLLTQFVLKYNCGNFIFTRKPFKYITKNKIITKSKR